MKYQAPFGSSDPNDPYVDRNTPGAVNGSKVPAAAIEDPQRELVALIGAAGITPDDTDLAQVPKAIQSGKLNYVAAGGTANALTGAFSPVLAPADYKAGLEVNILIATTNTSAVTFNGVAVVNSNGGALIAGDFVAGNIAGLIHDGTRFRLRGISRGRLINIQYFKTPGTATYTPTPGTLYVEVEVQAAAGAGGGAPLTVAAQTSAAGGGASGNYARKLITSAFAGVTVTVGAGGVGVSGGNGGNGGSSSFGALVSATGGLGGQTAGPTGTGVNFIAVGGAITAVGVSGDVNFPGVAGASLLIVSAQGVIGPPAVAMFSGGPGAGGVGSGNSPSQPAKVGANGNDGIVIIREYA
jgi:hypothetical protein